MTTANATGKSLKERAVNFLINKVVGMANRKIDIASLQRELNAHEAKVTRMVLTDLGKSWHFRVKDGVFEYLNAPPEVHGGFETTSDVLLQLATGKQRRMNPATSEVFEQDFTPIDAVTQGAIRIWGDAASNDMLLFARRLYKSVYEDLRAELASSKKP